MLLIGPRRFLAGIFLIMIYASTSLAAVNNESLSSALIMNPPKDSSNYISMTINSDWFANDFTKFTPSTTSARTYKPVNLREFFEKISAISLSKDSDKGIWSLSPTLSKYSLNPVNDIKNIQVLLRYRF